MHYRLFSNKIVPGIYVKCISLEDGTRLSKVFNRIVKRCKATTSSNNSMKNQLINQMRATGAITFADYMKQVLTNPLHGYYMTQDVFGSRGDFTTSPEISQIFGEMLGVWCLDSWNRMGRPKPLQLVELGPGRGTLASDICRVFSKLESANKDAISMHLVEISPHLSGVQMETLCGSKVEWEPTSDVCHQALSKHGIRCSWHRQLQQVPNNFSIYIAHEFFDAMPVYKLQKKDGDWREILVDIDENAPNAFRYVLARNPTPASILFKKENAECTLSEAEFSPESGVLMGQLCERIVEDGGALLIADYGHQGDRGDTSRGFSRHQVVHPLSSPGHVDVTADVDFRYLRKIADQHEIVCFGPVEQRDFLSRLGIHIRLEKLLENVESAEEKAQLKSGCEMLLNADQMGRRFHFLSVFPSVIEVVLRRHPPAGFQPNSQSI